MILSGSPTIYTVNSTTATGTGSGNSGDLVYAVDQANVNTNPAGSLIEFSAAVFDSPQTITLNETLMLSEAAGQEVIDGPSAALVTISEPIVAVHGSYPPLDGESFGLIHAAAGVTATLSGLTFSAGLDGLNNAAVNFDGGGIDNAGTLTVTGCTISGNSLGIGSYSGPPGNGGGIYNASSGTLTITGSTITDNQCGGGYGGGIYNLGTMTVAGSTVSDNTGVGIDNLATMTIADSTISDNHGSGISTSGALSISNSTIADNDAEFGAGIDTSGALTLINCTISGNTLSGDSSTYGGAAGGGMDIAGGTAVLDNTLVAGNRIPTGDLGAGGFAGYARRYRWQACPPPVHTT